MDLLHVVTSRPVIVSLAIVGAVLVSVPGLLRRPDVAGRVDAPVTGIARTLTRLGYAVSCLSVVLFIVAGFRNG